MRDRQAVKMKNSNRRIWEKVCEFAELHVTATCSLI